MAKIQFYHPDASPNTLYVDVKPNQIEWSYGLNVANFPTYGGEVVQILSAYIDDLTVTGNVRTYQEIEEIYSWFITYIQLATQGVTGVGRYNVKPVQMSYFERGWKFNIYPTGVPGFKYGRDVVAPEWKLTAAVVDPAQGLLDKITTEAAETAGEDGLPLFGVATGEIGFEPHNPFSDPLGGEGKLGEKNTKRFLKGQSLSGFKTPADAYNELLPAYLEGNFEDLTADYSKPVVEKAEEKAKTKAKKNG